MNIRFCLGVIAVSSAALYGATFLVERFVRVHDCKEEAEVVVVSCIEYVPAEDLAPWEVIDREELPDSVYMVGDEGGCKQALPVKREFHFAKFENCMNKKKGLL